MPSVTEVIDWRARFGRRVRELRQEAALTQEALASEAQIDLTYMGGIERGRRNPSLLVIVSIANALSVPPQALFESPAN